jgi:hypothetical protein
MKKLNNRILVKRGKVPLLKWQKEVFAKKVKIKKHLMDKINAVKKDDLWKDKNDELNAFKKDAFAVLDGVKVNEIGPEGKLIVQARMYDARKEINALIDGLFQKGILS